MILHYENMCVFACGCVPRSASALRGQKILLDPLGLQVQLILSCPASGLGMELESSTRPASTRNHSAISLTLRINVASFKCVVQYY